MKEQYVRDLTDGAKVDAVFALRCRDIRSARTGEAYLSLRFADRTGAIGAVMFRPGADDEALPVGSVVRVRGAVDSYRGTRRISVEALAPVESYDPEDLMASGARPRAELLEELRGLVRRIGDTELRGVVRSVLGAKGFIDRFATSPATVSGHHAYIGGLLEHTVSVATKCLALSRTCEQADVDLLLAAALLHDVGVVEGLSFETTFDSTDAGRLLGHVILGERIVSTAAARTGCDPSADRLLRLAHVMLAHHDGPSAGSPVRPCSVESLLLRAADSLDSDIAVFLDTTVGAGVLGQAWTGISNRFGRELLVPATEGRAACVERHCA